MLADFSWWWLAYPLLGIVVGFMAGLLGVGGGLLTVPILLWINGHLAQTSDDLYKIVLGSSMAAIAFTSFSSMVNHHRSGNVDWHAVKKLVMGLLLGSFVGGYLIVFIADRLLAGIFIVFAGYTALQFFLDWKPKASRILPNTPAMVGFGAFTGAFSAMISAGGGFLIVPFMVWCNVHLKKAVATSAACGFPIAIFGTIGYIVSGWGRPGLLPHSLGFVHLPSTLGIALTSMIFAGIGARASQKLPVHALKKVFALMLTLIAYSIFNKYFWQSVY